MSAITIRNIPKPVHDKLKAIALKEGVSVEALAREALAEVADKRGGWKLDFEKARELQQALQIDPDIDLWPPWFDDPAFSRHVLGLEEDGAPPYVPPPAAVPKKR